jgi:hypothetical protein
MRTERLLTYRFCYTLNLVHLTGTESCNNFIPYLPSYLREYFVSYSYQEIFHQTGFVKVLRDTHVMFVDFINIKPIYTRGTQYATLHDKFLNVQVNYKQQILKFSSKFNITFKQKGGEFMH